MKTKEIEKVAEVIQSINGTCTIKGGDWDNKDCWQGFLFSDATINYLAEHLVMNKDCPVRTAR